MQRLTIGAGLTVLTMTALSFTAFNANGRSMASGNAGSHSLTTKTTATADDDNLSARGAPTVAGSVVAAGSGQQTGPTGCRAGDPLANVYHPNRLMVVQPCLTVSGTVRSVQHENDGDIHFDLALDPSYTYLLTPANMTYQRGRLVAEIVPADAAGCTPGQAPRPPTGTYNYGICTGADESAPSIRSHVFVTGPYVLDKDHHRWAEIHPVWAVSSTLSTAPSPTSPSSTTTAPPPPQTTSPPPTASPGQGIVHPGAFCSPVGATGQTTDGTPMVCGPASDGRNRWHEA